MALNPAQIRYPVIPGVSQAVQEELTTLRRMIYQQQETPATPVTPTIPAPVTVTSSSSSNSGGGGGAPSATIYANVPLLASVPSNNPAVGQPYANDGTVVDVMGALYRYNRDTLTWDLLVNAISLTDTHANRLANYPSVNYPTNTRFCETDRTTTYWVQNATGTVTVAGGVNVTWVGGNKFINTGTGFTAAQWPAGTPIVIAGVLCHVGSVTNSGALVLSTATTNGAGVSYSVASGRWVYLMGQYSAAIGSIPTDLGENDTATTGVAFLFGETTYSHVLKWNTSAWNWAPGEPGSGMMVEFEVDPTGPGWHLYDGTVGVVYLKADGTTGTQTLPDLVSGAGMAAFVEAGSPNSGPTAAVAPTFTGNALTPTGTVSAPTFIGNAAALTTTLFTPVALATPALTSIDGSATSYTPSGTNSAPTFTGAPVTPTGTISATAEPRKIVRRPFFRQ